MSPAEYFLHLDINYDEKYRIIEFIGYDNPTDENSRAIVIPLSIAIQEIYNLIEEIFKRHSGWNKNMDGFKAIIEELNKD